MNDKPCDVKGDKVVDINQLKPVPHIKGNHLCHSCQTAFELEHPVALATVPCIYCGEPCETEYITYFKKLEEVYAAFTIILDTMPQSYAGANARTRISEGYMWSVSAMNSRITQGPAKKVMPKGT